MAKSLFIKGYPSEEIKADGEMFSHFQKPNQELLNVCVVNY